MFMNGMAAIVRSRSRSPAVRISSSSEAMRRLDSAFRANSCDGVPENLRYLLCTYDKGSTAEEKRKNLYKRIYGLIWYGSGRTIGVGSKVGGRGPTYVYPTALKEVVRARFSSCIKDWEDPTGPQVYHVTYKDLTSVKWPKK